MQLKGHMAGARLDTRVRLIPFCKGMWMAHFAGGLVFAFFPFCKGLGGCGHASPFLKGKQGSGPLPQPSWRRCSPPPAPPVVLLPGRDRKDCQVHEVSFLQDVCSVIDHDGAAVVHGVGSFAPPPCSGPHTEGPLQGPEPWADGQFGQAWQFAGGMTPPTSKTLWKSTMTLGRTPCTPFSQRGLASSPFFKGTASILGASMAGSVLAGSELAGWELLCSEGGSSLTWVNAGPWATLSQDLPSRAGLAFSLSSCHCFLSFSKDSHDLMAMAGGPSPKGASPPTALSLKSVPPSPPSRPFPKRRPSCPFPKGVRPTRTHQQPPA